MITDIIQAMKVFYLDIFSIIPLGCKFNFHYFTQLLMWTLMPIAVTLFLLVCAVCEYYYYRHCNYRFYLEIENSNSNNVLEKNEMLQLYNNIKNKYLSYFFYLTYLILPSVSSKIFQMFLCTNINPDHEHYHDIQEHDTYLTADVGIPCDTAYWKNCSYYAICMVAVYPVGIPLMYLWLLNQRKKEISNRKFITNSSHSSSHHSDGHNYNHSINNHSINNHNCGMGHERYTDSARSMFAKSHGTASSRSVYKQELLKHRDEISRLSMETICIKFLWEPYKPEYWFWEFFESYRRILLTSVITVIAPGTSTQRVLAILLSLFTIKIYGYFLPYALLQDGELAEVGQYQIFFTFFIILLIKDNILQGWNSALGTK